jgi:uncharacterized protein DUF2530
MSDERPVDPAGAALPPPPGAGSDSAAGTAGAAGAAAAGDRAAAHDQTVGVPPTPVAPIVVNSARVVWVGIALWAVGFIVLLPFYSELGRHHHRIWLWTCLAGVGVGLFGYTLTRRHKATGRTD